MGLGKEAVDRPLSSSVSEEVTRKSERTCQIVTFGPQVTSADAGNRERGQQRQGDSGAPLDSPLAHSGEPSGG